MSAITVKQNWEIFLTTLIRLSDELPAVDAENVLNLIQGFIDGTLQAEEFTNKLQIELKSDPEPYLLPFLKDNIPYLRYLLITKELTIEGVRPPPPGTIVLPHPQSKLKLDKMFPDMAKEKCENFLSTLIRLADDQPAVVVERVRNLIQDIIDGTMQPEEFAAKLQKELNSAPQPYLVPYLKDNLPLLRRLLITEELTIEGVRPPLPGARTHSPPRSNLQHVQRTPIPVKQQWKNFLTSLIRLADEQPPVVAKNVRNLIQDVIDGKMQAEEFPVKLQKELNSTPQPYLVAFFKDNISYLRHLLITKELTIEGVRPPPPDAITLPHPQSNLK